MIDFGIIGIGDPACDLAIAWTLLDGDSRAAMGLDLDTWRRGRGWALWKAPILVTGVSQGHPRDVAQSSRVLQDLIAESLERVPISGNRLSEPNTLYLLEIDHVHPFRRFPSKTDHDLAGG